MALRNPLPSCLGSHCMKNESVYLVIWTTTPWTLPANQAVCFDPEKSYCLVRSKAHGDQYLVIASELRSTLEQSWSTQLSVLSEFPGILKQVVVLNSKLNAVFKNILGSALAECRYSHPLDKSKELPLLPAGHVSMSKGTGFVHTAPAHGPEDFLVALQHKIPIVTFHSSCFFFSVLKL